MFLTGSSIVARAREPYMHTFCCRLLRQYARSYCCDTHSVLRVRMCALHGHVYKIRNSAYVNRALQIYSLGYTSAYVCLLLEADDRLFWNVTNSQNSFLDWICSDAVEHYRRHCWKELSVQPNPNAIVSCCGFCAGKLKVTRMRVFLKRYRHLDWIWAQTADMRYDSLFFTNPYTNRNAFLLSTLGIV